MGARTRRVCEHPSSRHGGAVSEAAVEGTRAWTALGHREVPKKVPTAPLTDTPVHVYTYTSPKDFRLTLQAVIAVTRTKRKNLPHARRHARSKPVKSATAY